MPSLSRACRCLDCEVATQLSAELSVCSSSIIQLNPRLNQVLTQKCTASSNRDHLVPHEAPCEAELNSEANESLSQK